ncbi:MAG: hypothetical protein AAFQ68_13175 [Bacteroidota bacterium]
MMKTLMISLATATTLFLGIAASPNAFTASPEGNPSCTSLFARIANAFDEAVRTMIDFRAEAAEVIVGDAIPEVELDGLIDDIKDAQIRIYESAGEIVGDKGTPGPVNLTVPFKNYQGTCYTERTFFCAHGPFDHQIVKIKKLGGKNGADIAVCKYDVNGNYLNTKYLHFDKGSGSDGQTKTITMKGMKNEKYLTIHIVTLGLISNAFKYRLDVTGEFNYDKLKDEKPASPVFVPRTRTDIKK